MMDFAQLRSLYQSTLLNDVIPFWMRHAIDADGAINTCIADDGTVINRDRWAWSQWRAVWVFAKLYNSVERRSEWLKIAEGIAGFAIAHGPLEDGHWPMQLDAEGKVIRGFESIFADGFAIYGLVELWRATHKKQYGELAVATFRAAEQSLNAAEPPPAYPYPIPAGRMNHGVSMLFSMVYYELAEAKSDPAVREASLRHHRRVMDRFLRPDRGLVVEWLDLEGNEIAPPDGTVVLPGHAIESMWMQIHIALETGDSSVIERAVEAIRRHLEAGWDAEYGGLFLAVDADGRPEVAWPYADTKLWWPHTEALYATLLAYEISRQNWCLEWYQRIHDYAFSHYPVKEHGEWKQKLDRRGLPIAEVVALPVKDPFHLPRSLIYGIEVLSRLGGKG